MSAQRYSWLVVASALFLQLTGALVTGLAGGGNIAQLFLLHLLAGSILAILVLIQFFRLQRGDPVARKVNWLALGTLIAQAGSGGGHGTALPASLAIVHASLAPVALAAVVMVAVLLSAQARAPQLLPGNLRMLRRAAFATPPLVFLQIVLGALYRHKSIEVLYHMGGALLVTLLALIVSAVITQRLTVKTPLRHAAVMVMSIVLTQVTLGIGAFVMRLLDQDSTMVFTVIAALHVTVGSLVLASTSVLAFYCQKIAFGES